MVLAGKAQAAELGRPPGSERPERTEVYRGTRPGQLVCDPTEEHTRHTGHADLLREALQSLFGGEHEGSAALRGSFADVPASPSEPHHQNGDIPYSTKAIEEI